MFTLVCATKSAWGTSGIDFRDHLLFFGAAALAVALAGDDQGVGMMGQPIEGGAGEEAITEGIRPLREGAVAGDDQRLALIALTDELVEVFGALGNQGAEAEVVDHQKPHRSATVFDGTLWGRFAPYGVRRGP